MAGGAELTSKGEFSPMNDMEKKTFCNSMNYKNNSNSLLSMEKEEQAFFPHPRLKMLPSLKLRSASSSEPNKT
jgi:hypothetical protein